MQPISARGKENGEAITLVASAWNQWGEASDSLRLRYAAPTRLTVRRAPDPELPSWSEASPKEECCELKLDMRPLSSRLLQGLVLLEGAAAASVTIGSSAAAALLGIAVLLGFLASNLPIKRCRLTVATLPWVFCSVALGSGPFCPEASPGLRWLSPVGATIGMMGSLATFSSHLFESDRFGFFLTHAASTLSGIACMALAIVQIRIRKSEANFVKTDWWDLPTLPDVEIVFAGQLAALLFLVALSLLRVVLAVSVHPFAQPLRAPHLAKTLLERQQSTRDFGGEALPKVPLFSPPRSAARSGVRQAALSRSTGHLGEQEPESEEQDIDAANSESSDGLCAGVLQVLLEAADWPASHCLTPHRVRSGAPLIHWKLVPRSSGHQDRGRMNFNPPLRELASSSSRAAEPAEGQEEKEEEKETHAKEQERSEQEEIVDTAEDSCRAGVSADPLSLDSAAAASTQEQLKIDDTGLAGDEMQGDQESVKSQLSVQDVQEVQTKLGDGTKHCPARGSHEVASVTASCQSGESD